MNKEAHSRDLLVSQFLVSRSEALVPAGWSIFEVSSWLLAAHPKCPVNMVISGGGVIGALVGWVITPRGTILRGPLVVSSPGEGNANDLIDHAAKEITKLSGRFAALLASGSQERFYLDPCGSLAALYSLDDELVVSTASVIGKDQSCDDWDAELVERLPYTPFGLSPHQSLRRVIPNHYLDLREWRLTRFWPTHAPEIGLYATQLTNIGNVLRRNVVALADEGGWFNLTGGIDSRMVCSFLVGEGKQARFFTSNDEATDKYLSCKIAEKYRLDHHVLRVEEATNGEIQRRLFISGYCVDKPGLSKRPGRDWALAQAPFQISGHGGEILRGYFWKNKDPERLRVSSGGEIVAYMGLARIERLVKAADLWLESLPDLQAYDLLDIAYLEQRMASWAAPNMYYFDSAICPTLYGFNVPELIRLVFRICPHKRRSQKLARDLIGSECSSLLRFPINNYSGIRGCRTAATRRAFELKHGAIRCLGRLRSKCFRRLSDRL